MNTQWQTVDNSNICYNLHMSPDSDTNQELTENTPLDSSQGAVMADKSIPRDNPVNMGSSTADTPSEPLEAPINADTSVSLKDANQGANSPECPNENTGISAENPPVEPVSESNPEPISEPVQTSESGTAQIPGNEPLSSRSEPLGEPETKSVSNSGGMSEAKSEPEKINSVPIIVSNKNKVLELLNKAKLAIQSRKRKKLDKVMAIFAKQTKISNDEVEKFLHVSDATAERYLNILERENKIKQTGKTGHSVFYSKI